MTTTESLDAPVNNLPEFSGDLSAWERDVSVLREAFTKLSIDYEAQLPEVIGYLAPDELEAINRWPKDHDIPTVFFSGEERLNETGIDLRQELASAIRTIEEDVKLVTGGLGFLASLEAEKSFTSEGKSPRPLALHLDRYVDRPERAILPFYLFADIESSCYYQGPAGLYIPGRYIELSMNRVDADKPGAIVQAKPGAIVRLSGATAHKSPVFSSGETRALMRAAAELNDA